MINSVRNTVLAIANKNNYGYISPQDFNLYAQQAQMDLFEDYFYQYNAWTNKENQRISGTGYADIVKGLVEVMDSFSVTRSLAQKGNNLFNLQGFRYTTCKYYRIMPKGTRKCLCCNNDTNGDNDLHTSHLFSIRKHKHSLDIEISFSN